jgi:RNA polymerase sigma factor (sigma-70 family)
MAIEDNECAGRASPHEASGFGTEAATGNRLVEPVPDRDSAAGGWVALVEGVKSGDRGAMEELYANFSRGVRYYFCKHLGPADLDDRVHDAYLTVVHAIRNGSLREPAALMGFVKTIIRRQVAAGIDEVVQSRRERAEFDAGVLIPDERQNPEQEAIGKQKIDLMAQVLREISDRDREILTRFYVHNQSQEEICQAMGLTETQFRLLKSRAKARFGELGRRLLAHTDPEVGLRRMAGA